MQTLDAKTERLLTSTEAARLLGLKSPQTLTVWRRTKKFPDLEYVKIGRVVRYRKQAIEAFIAKNCMGNAETNEDKKLTTYNKIDIAKLIRAAFYHKLDRDEIFDPEPEPETAFDEYKAKAKWFVDLKTGAIEYASEDSLKLAMTYQTDPEDDMDMEWYDCTLGLEIAIVYDREGRFRELPKADAFQQEEFDWEFVQYLELALDELQQALISPKTFRDCISEHSLTERWDEFRQRRAMIQWCQENGIEWQEDPARALADRE